MDLVRDVRADTEDTGLAESVPLDSTSPFLPTYLSTKVPYTFCVDVVD